MKNGDLHKRKKIDYQWVMIGLCFLMILTSLGFCSSGKSLYLTAITEALGISRSAYSVSDSFRYISQTLINLFFGALMYHIGSKRLIAIGFACLIGFALISSFTTSLIGFYIAGVLLGIGLSFTSTTMTSAIINKWCKKNKGTITGAVLAANGIGGALCVQIISPLIYQEGNPLGYQDSYRLVALILFVVAVLIMIFYKDEPKETANIPQTSASPKKKARGEGWVGIDYSQAIKKSYFYLIAFCIFITGMILQGITGIAIPHMLDVGLDSSYVTSVLSFSSILLACSKFLVGFLYDRFGLRSTMNICLTSSFAVMFLLLMITDSPLGKVFAVAYAVFSVIALPLETVMVPLYVSDLFGDKSFDKILGILLSANTAGFALSTPLANWCYDFFGSYNIAFFTGAVLMLIVTVLLQFVVSAASREKKKILTCKI